MNSQTMRGPVLLAALSLFGLGLTVTLGALGDEDSLIALPLLFVGALAAIPFLNALSRGSTLAMMALLAMLVFVTDGNFRARDWADKSLDWQVMMKAGVWALAGIVGMMHWRHVRPLLSQAPIVFALVFVLILFASALWSPNPAYGLVSAGAYVCMLLFALVAVNRLTTDQLLIALAIGFGLVVVPSALMSPFTRSFAGISEGSTAELHRLRGMVEHPIPMAEDGAIFIFLCGLLLMRFRRHALPLLLLILAGLWVVWETRSRIPPASMVAAISFVWFYRKGGAWSILPLGMAVMVVLVMGTALTGIEGLLPRPLLEIVARGGGIQEVLTLSGRTTIWPYVMDLVRSNWLLGYGHAAGMDIFKGFSPWKIVHAHNAYLQTLLYTGIVGMASLLLVIGYQLKVFLRKPDLFRDGLLIAILFKGITEQSFIANLPNSTTLLWMMTVVLAWRVVAEERLARREARRRHQAMMEARAQGQTIDITPTRA